MKWRVIIRPNAETDLREAWSWYEKQRPGLGNQFLTEVHSAVRFLEDNPATRPLYYRNFRRMLTSRFPYKIFYMVERQRVIIFRVLHAKRDHRRHL